MRDWRPQRRDARIKRPARLADTGSERHEGGCVASPETPPQTLEAEDFHWIGESLRKLGIPVFSVLEGGYSNDLPDLILAYLKGLEGK